MHYAQHLVPDKESSTLMSETATHNSFLRLTEVKLLLALNGLVILSLAMLLVAGWLVEVRAQALLNLLFMLGLAG